MPKISSLIYKGLTLARVLKANFKIPVGSIVFCSSQTIPANWVRYSEADNYYIMGTATQSLIGTYQSGSSTDTGSMTTNTNGVHTGSASYTINASGTGGQLTIGIWVSAGNHSHTISFSPSAIVQPPAASLILIKSTVEQELFPVNSIVISGIKPKFTTQYLAAYTYTFIKGGSTVTSSAATSANYTGLTSTAGEHTHYTQNNIGTTYTGSTASTAVAMDNVIDFQTSYAEKYPGSHTHTVTGTVTGTSLPGKILKLWQHVSSRIPSEACIIMYSGNIATLPSYWKVCDGTNNTVNLVDQFIGYSSDSNMSNDTSTSGDGAIVSNIGSVTSTASFNHRHHQNNYFSSNNVVISNMLHNYTGNVGHSHTVNASSVSCTAIPQSIKLCFIQFFSGSDIINTEPDSPVLFTATAIDNHSVSLSFNEPFNGNSTIKYYTIVSVPSTITTTITAVLDYSTISYYLTVNNLLSNTSYIFSITATNDIGTSEAVSSNSVTTANG